MFNTFKEDFSEEVAFDYFLKPQLDLLSDKNWKVRTQVCYNLAAFNVKNDDVVLALIMALNDADPDVR
jgi:hypothetical protein